MDPVTDRLEAKLDALVEMCSGLRADVRELQVRQENLEGTVKHYARSLNLHVQEDEEVSDRVGSLEIWRSRAQGFAAGAVAVASLVGAALGAAVSWLLGR